MEVEECSVKENGDLSSPSSSLESSNMEENTERESMEGEQMEKVIQEHNPSSCSTGNDISLLKQLVSEYFAEVFPLLEISKLKIEKLNLLSTMKSNSRLHNNNTLTSTSTSISESSNYMWRILQALIAIKTKRSNSSSSSTTTTTTSNSNNNYVAPTLPLSLPHVPFSIKCKPPTVTSAEIDEFLSTRTEVEIAELLSEFDEEQSNDIECIINNTIEEWQEQHLKEKTLKVYSEEHNENLIRRKETNKLNEEISASNECKELSHHESISSINENIKNEKIEEEKYSKQNLENNNVQMYKSKWLAEESNVSSVANNCTTENMYQTIDSNTNELEYQGDSSDTRQNCCTDNSNEMNANTQNNSRSNNNESNNIIDNDSMTETNFLQKQEEVQEQKVDEFMKQESQESLFDVQQRKSKNVEAEENEESDEESAMESESMEESFDQFSRRVLARDEWAKISSANSKDVQKKVMEFMNQANKSFRFVSSQEEEQEHQLQEKIFSIEQHNEEVELQRKEQEEWEEEEEESEEEFVIPSREHFQEQPLLHESTITLLDDSNTISATMLNSELSSSSHTNVIHDKNVKIKESNAHHSANNSSGNSNNTKLTRKELAVVKTKMELKSPLPTPIQPRGWKSYFSNIVTRKVSCNGDGKNTINKNNNNNNDAVNKEKVNDHITTSKLKLTKDLESSQQKYFYHDKMSYLKQSQFVTIKQKRIAYLRKRAYDILLANKVHERDCQTYIHHLNHVLETQTQELVNAVLPLINQLTTSVQQSCVLLDVVAEIDRATFGACIPNPSQYLTSPRYRARCAEITCQAFFSTTVTRITCRRCGEVYCPRCCTERGIGPDVFLSSSHLIYNNGDSFHLRKCANSPFLLQATTTTTTTTTSNHKNGDNDEGKEAAKAHRNNNDKNDKHCMNGSNANSDNNNVNNDSSNNNNYSEFSNPIRSTSPEQHKQREGVQQHTSLGWEPICMRCWRVCAENVKRVALERRRRSLIQQSQISRLTNSTPSHQSTHVRFDHTCHKTSKHNNANNIDYAISSNNNNISKTMESQNSEMLPSKRTESHIHSQAYSENISTTASTLPTTASQFSRKHIALEELSVKEAVLLGAYCDNSFRLQDGFAPFYVLTKCANDTAASRDIITYKLAKAGSAWRTHWQQAGKWSALALQYACLQSQNGLTNLRTQIKWHLLLQHLKEGAASTKKLLLTHNKRLLNSAYKTSSNILMSSSSIMSTNNNFHHRVKRIVENSNVKRSKKDYQHNTNKVIVSDDDDFDDNEDYDEATLLNHLNRYTEYTVSNDNLNSLDIMTSEHIEQSSVE